MKSRSGCNRGIRGFAALVQLAAAPLLEMAQATADGPDRWMGRIAETTIFSVQTTGIGIQNADRDCSSSHHPIEH